MIFYSHLKVWEQPDGRIPFLDSSTDLTLDQTCNPNADLWTCACFLGHPPGFEG